MQNGERTEDRISALEKDMWRGNGKPGITTRLATLEDDVERLERKQRLIANQGWAILLLLLTLMGTVIATRHTDTITQHSSMF